MMKKSSVKRLLALVLVLALVLSVMAVTVLADDSDVAVVYDGKEDAVVFKNPLKAWLSGEHEHPDLFTDFKNLMPGDSVTQTITVGAQNIGSDTVRIYLRPEMTTDARLNEDYKLLTAYKNWITFTVTIPGAKESEPPQELDVTEPGENTENLAVDGNGAVTLAEGDFSNGVLLGTFKTARALIWM